MNDKLTIFWHRRDLRLHDNAGAYHALKSNFPVLSLFIFDKNILDKLSDKSDARVHFIHQAITDLSQELSALGSTLIVKYGSPQKVWEELIKEYPIASVITNKDYEPYALERDNDIQAILQKQDISFKSFKDHVIFEKDEVLKDDGNPYTVFTPYKRKWLTKLESEWMQGTPFYFKSYPNKKYFKNYAQVEALPIPHLKDMGFTESVQEFPSTDVKQALIKNYENERNFPGIKGTSRLGIHFRFGTISIREKALKARSLSSVYLSELIWRDFYSMILSHFPHVVKNAFRAKYEYIPWRDAPEDFQKWCVGKTGYPIVDAGMRELNETGFMHNRVRMVVASFLTKHLLIDWRLGEAYFAEKLLDFDLASNNGGWQWAAGCGTDAAPYFRIFNPESQQKKFDKDLQYIKKWVPELDTDAYPKPMVDHKYARERCLSTYKAALANAT